MLGRFVGVLRALVPAIARAARMTYRTFLPYNAAGGVLWASAFVFAAYLAGNSYQRLADVAGRAGLLLAIVLAARWVARHPDRAAGRCCACGTHHRSSAWADRCSRQVAFLTDRLRPGAALGLLPTEQLALLAALGAAYGVILDDVVRHEELISIDRPVATFVVAHREPWLTTLLRSPHGQAAPSSSSRSSPSSAWAFGAPRECWRPLRFLTASHTGATARSTVIKLAVARPRPDAGALVDALGYSGWRPSSSPPPCSRSGARPTPHIPRDRQRGPRASPSTAPAEDHKSCAPRTSTNRTTAFLLHC